MTRKVFFSFDYKWDATRVAKIRNIGVVEGQPLLSSNKWEEVKKGGDRAIQAWIDGQMRGTSCVVVLIGSRTARRRWVEYEFKKGWGARKGLLGVYIHNLKNLEQQQSRKGANPFLGFTVGASKKKLSTVVKAYDPPYTTSTSVYGYIAANLEAWVEEAIRIRNTFVA
jgi:hypothetical protein